MVEEGSVLRLSVLLYGENNTDIDIEKDKVIKKLIFSILLERDNKEVDLGELCKKIKSKNKLIFTTDHIMKVVKKYRLDFVLKKERKNFKSSVYLNPDKYKELGEVILKEENNWENLLESFYRTCKTDFNFLEIKEIINRHLYNSIKINYEEYRKLFQKSLGIKHRALKEFTKEEVEIISYFHSWENGLKNTYLQKIYSIGIELALISNDSIVNEKLQTILNKKFFLDTNILYRSLGINGEERQEIILNFLETCQSHKSELYISEYTEEELRESLRHKMRVLKKYDSGSYIPEKIFNKYTHGYGIFHYYNKWKAENRGLSLEMFEAEIFSKYNEFKKKFNIKNPKKIELNEEENIELNQMFDSYTYKKFEKMNENPHKVTLDLKNILMINKLREGKDQNLVDTEYFFISTDQKLKHWEYERSNYLPTILLPSQWLNIILTYGKRTVDDYQSFSSLLSLKSNEGYFSEEELYIICDGIRKVNEKVSKTKVLDYMIEKDFKKLILEADECDDFILEKSEELTKDYLQDELEEIRMLKEVELKNIEKLKEKEIEVINKKQSERIAEIEKVNMNEIEKIKKNKEAEKTIEKSILIEKIENEKNIRIKREEEVKRIKNQIEEGVKREVTFIVIIPLIIYTIAILIAISKLGWEKMEPITYILSLIFLVACYIITAINYKEFNPKDILEVIYDKRREKKLNKFGFDN